jgi:hypothetical protein
MPVADLWKMMRSKSAARREREIEAEANKDENGVVRVDGDLEKKNRLNTHRMITQLRLRKKRVNDNVSILTSRIDNADSQSNQKTHLLRTRSLTNSPA